MKKLSSFFLLFMFIGLLSLAQWSIDPNENTPIAVATGDQAIPMVATSSSGITYISWFSNESGNYNVRLQKLDLSGNKLWAEEGILVSDNPSMTWLTDWDMTVDQEDFAILTFQDIRNGDNDVFAYRISPDGEFAWGEEGIEMSSGPAFDVSPKVTVTQAGNAVFAWQADAVVILQKISPDGTKMWGENGIILSGSHTYSWPQLLPVGEDDVVLKFFEDSGPAWAPTRHVFAQRYDTDGNTVWDEHATVSNAGGISAWTQIFSFINNGSDGFYMAWHDDRDNNMLSSVFVQHVNAEGEIVFSDNGVEASTMAGRNHFYPHLSLPVGSQEVFVFWNEMDGDQNYRGIYGQKLTTMGERLWTDNGTTFIEISATNVYPFAAGNSDEDAIVFYEHYFDGINAAIRAMRIDADGNYVWNDQMIELCSVNSQKIHTEAGSFHNGQWILAWEDTRNGNADIYGQNIQLDGSLGPIVFPSNLTVTPDSVICDEIGPHYVYVENNTPNAILINEIYFEQGIYLDFEDLPDLPYNISSGEILEIEFYVMVITYNPNGYEYDLMKIESEVDTNEVVIAINQDLLENIKSSSNHKKLTNAFPNPSQGNITFTFMMDEIPSQLVIYNYLGQPIRSFEINGFRNMTWDGKDENNQRVPAGMYYYRIMPENMTKCGSIILLN